MKFEVSERLLSAIEKAANALKAAGQHHTIQDAIAKGGHMAAVLEAGIEENEEDVDMLKGFVSRARQKINDPNNT